MDRVFGYQTVTGGWVHGQLLIAHYVKCVFVLVIVVNVNICKQLGK